MKMRKNFALIAVLAIAVFVASAGLVSAYINGGPGDSCSSDAECNGDLECRNVISQDQDVCAVSGVVEEGPDRSRYDKITPVAVESPNAVLSNGSDGCPDGSCDIPGTIVKGPSGTFFVPGERSVSLGESGAKVSCGNGQEISVSKTGSGEDGSTERAKAAQGCISDEDCPAPGSVCKNGECQEKVRPQAGTNDGFLGTGLFTANN